MAFDMLFSPIKIGGVVIKNRIALAPMGICLNPESNEIDENYVAYFEARAKGGVGLITSSPACIDEELSGFADAGQYCLTKPEHVEGIKKIADAVHKYGAKISIQLLHPGRQGGSALSKGQQPVAPSPLKEAEFDWLEMPRELTEEEIHSLIEKYINGARYAYEGGADGVEIHAAHGYLIHQFMCPRANKRSDAYGGNFENRMRFVTEIIEGIRKIKPDDRFLSIRINATDFSEEEGALGIEENKEIAKYLEGLGVDAISISGGTYSCQDKLIAPQIYEEGWRTDAYLKEFKGLLHIPVFAANHIKRPATAEKMLKDGICDVVLLGRQMMADPCWAKKAESGKADQIRYCISCNHCTDQVTLAKPVRCSVNPYLAQEAVYNEDTLVKNGNGRQVVVIGGGPAGCEAALLASRKGFTVTLFEKSCRLGGSIDLPRVANGMSKEAWTADAFAARVMASDVIVKLNTEVTEPEQVLSLNPYAVIVATGGNPGRFPIPGIDQKHVIQAHEVLHFPDKISGKKVALVGSGMTGLETAEVLVGHGCMVDIYEMQDEIAKGANMKNKYALAAWLQEKGVNIHLSEKLVSIGEDTVSFENAMTGQKTEQDADYVVLSMGVRPDKKVQEILQGRVEKLYAIGDCADGKVVVDATREAFETVWNMK